MGKRDRASGRTAFHIAAAVRCPAEKFPGGNISARPGVYRLKALFKREKGGIAWKRLKSCCAMPWNTTAPPSTGWPCARMQSVQDAEDVYQDVFLRLLGQEASAWDGEHLRAWLLRCTVNRCHDLHRFRLRRPVLALADLPETAAEADSGAAELWDAWPACRKSCASPSTCIMPRGIPRRRSPGAGHSGGHGPHPAPPGPKKTQRPAGRRRP